MTSLRSARVAEEVCDVPCVHPEVVARVRASVPDSACVQAASALLKVVADPTRLRLLSALNLEDLCVCDLANIAGISESAASHQLRFLRAQRLVTSRKEGRVVYYRLIDQHIYALIGSAIDHARE